MAPCRFESVHPRRRDAWLVGALLVLLAVPLFVALVALHSPRWYPLLDMAETEIRVRDVASTHAPLIGLAGRIGPFGANGGSHPGPLSFYALWPVWELFGRSAFGLQVANVALDIAAMGIALWIAYRRGGVRLALGIGTILAILTRAYGAYLLTLPWNPYLPVLWWFVFLLAVWSVLADDLVLLPVAVLAGSFCAQTHISYVGLVGGLVGVVVVAVGYSAVRRRGDPLARRALRVWGLTALVLGVVVWTPPVIDQIVHTPGNLTTLRDYFGHPMTPPIGLHAGVNVVLGQLNPIALVTKVLVKDTNPRPAGGNRLPGVLLLLAWAASVVVAWRLRQRALLLLDLVLATALALGVVSAARVFGFVWFYLFLWAWCLTALLLFVVGWTVVAFSHSRFGHGADRRSSKAGVAILSAVALVSVAFFADDAAHTTVQTPRLNEQLGALITPTARALARLRQGGQRGPYLVTWLPDPIDIGAEGYGLLNELDRRGFDVRAGLTFRPAATRYHVMDPARASLEVHLATGNDIARWSKMANYREVAYFDPRSASERQEFARLHTRVIEDLRRAKLSALVPEVDENLFIVALTPQIADSTRKLMTRMLDLGLPSAVFIGAPHGGA
jgi:hypothetical protein